MERHRISNHIYFPVATLLLVLFLLNFAGPVVAIVSAFAVPSLLCNLIFIMLPLYAKTYIILRTSMCFFQVIIVTILLTYVANLVLVFGTMTQCHIDPAKAVSASSNIAMFLSNLAL